MVQKIQTVLIDDLEPELEASGTVAFALDGATYEIDLNDEHIGELRAAFAPYVGAGRTVSGPRTARTPGRSRAARPRATVSAAAGTDGSLDAGAVRTWAREHGIAVSERGRIKGSVVTQFLEATGR